MRWSAFPLVAAVFAVAAVLGAGTPARLPVRVGAPPFGRAAVAGVEIPVAAAPDVAATVRAPGAPVDASASVRRDLETGAIDGCVVDDRGVPVDGARVALYLRCTAVSPAWSRLLAETVAAAGRLHLPAAPVRAVPDLVLEVSAPGHATRWPALEPGVARGEALRDLAVVLPRLVSATGRVLLPDGSPAVGARVRILADDDWVSRNAHAFPPRTDAAGRFATRAVDPGRVFWLVASTHERSTGRTLHTSRPIDLRGTAPGTVVDVTIQLDEVFEAALDVVVPGADAGLTACTERTGETPVERGAARIATTTGPHRVFLLKGGEVVARRTLYVAHAVERVVFEP